MPKHGTNIRKRADGRWEGRYKILQSDHTCKYRSVYGRTCREVKEKLEHSTMEEITSVVENRKEAENDREREDIFSATADRWLESIRETRKYSTYIKYRGLYERHIRDALGGVPVCAVSYGLVIEKI